MCISSPFFLTWSSAMRIPPILLLVVCLCLPLAALGQDKDKEDKFTCRIIYVPTDQAVVDKMLDMAKVTKDDIVFDLGCGDGRIVCSAAKKYGARGVSGWCGVRGSSGITFLIARLGRRVSKGL
jgi:hypothetical protein